MSMKILNRYLASSVLRSYCIVLAILLTLLSLMAFLDDVENVGKKQYTIWGAFEFLLMTLPSRLVLLAPFVALLGSIVALGGLANGRELTAMQAGGVSPNQIAWSVLKVGCVFIFLIACLSEFVVPPLDQKAYLKRSFALSESAGFQGEAGLWLRDGRRFIRIRHVGVGEVARNLDIFEFNEHGQMVTYLYAKEAEVGNPQKWVLKDIQKKNIRGFHSSLEHVETLEWTSPLNQEELQLLKLPISSLAPSDLYQYIGVLQRKQQNSRRYEMVFWDKVFLLLNSILMVVVSIPWLFGPLRSATIGKRVFVGSLMGMGFYLLIEVLKNLGLLFGVPPLLTLAIPFLGLLGLTIVIWRKAFSP